ncbi:MAG: hypothetical protein QOI62_3122 [Solirubrobacteraceae bacterium]|nr:hypothetical protein [Solirubrobacteraceae bacterium]
MTLYVTGSFGRLEARYDQSDPDKGSDLDVFFMYMPEDRSPNDLSRLAWFKLIAAVIDVAQDLKFKPFSRDGEFLKAHNVFHVGSELGSSNEDAENGFTARLLLLLEGRPLANDALFDRVLLETIGFYFRDFAEHREVFRPYALINDILRYWRTLCLNYEHQRAAKRSRLKWLHESIETNDELDKDAKQRLTEERNHDFRVDSMLDNLKLRYSRLALCFSMISLLASDPDGITPERVAEMCRTVPSERWALAAQRDSSGRASKLVSGILASYEGFLDLVADKDQALQRLRDQEESRRLKRSAAEFGDQISQLIHHVTTDDQFRRLVV